MTMPDKNSFSLARRLAAGEVVYTGWCGLPYPIVAELVARTTSEQGLPLAVEDQVVLERIVEIVSSVVRKPGKIGDGLRRGQGSTSNRGGLR